MFGLLIGLACGAGELFLLTRLTKALLGGDTFNTLLFVLCKLVLLAAAMVVVTIFLRRDLVWFGAGVTSVLVIGAFIINILVRKSAKGDR
jgi:hypothetical protein